MPLHPCRAVPHPDCGLPLRAPPRPTVVGRDEGSLELALGTGGLRALLGAQPFRLDLLWGRRLLCSVNPRGLLVFERPPAPPA